MICQKSYCDPINEEQRSVYMEFEAFMRFKMRFALFLTIVVLGCYFSFLALVAFFPEFLALNVGDSPITLGIIFGLCSILLGVLGTGMYSFVANLFLDSKETDIMERMEKVGLIIKEER
ncbi:DUF485 domain-containing protein [Helicobacter equorum]|uniref:DUF485 domain-containing protein n=1 Tax=Helicobacter equorum TaxID=361872 RepID=UPI000CF0BF25|nr:DUF485 domain-containing protein [Helicobacter equorum]